MNPPERSYSNMEIRALLQSNANTIIKNNQIIATGNCSNVLPINDTRVFGSPYLFNSIMDSCLEWDNPSDLKDNYISNYKKISNKCAPHIVYTKNLNL
jgi:hypothetical protein